MFVITPIVILILALGAGGAAAIGNSAEQKSVEASTESEAAAVPEPSEEEQDPILASSQRDLEHQPNTGPSPTGDSVENDPLYVEVNPVLWSLEDEKETVHPHD